MNEKCSKKVTQYIHLRTKSLPNTYNVRKNCLSLKVLKKSASVYIYTLKVPTAISFIVNKYIYVI